MYLDIYLLLDIKPEMKTAIEILWKYLMNNEFIIRIISTIDSFGIDLLSTWISWRYYNASF